MFHDPVTGACFAFGGGKTKALESSQQAGARQAAGPTLREGRGGAREQDASTLLPPPPPQPPAGATERSGNQPRPALREPSPAPLTSLWFRNAVPVHGAVTQLVGLVWAWNGVLQPVYLDSCLGKPGGGGAACLTPLQPELSWRLASICPCSWRGARGDVPFSALCLSLPAPSAVHPPPLLED